MVRTYPALNVEADFGGEFPYESKRVDVGDGVRMAYVDEGPRDAPLTFLLLHGAPTWGFLYRRFIDRLRYKHRVLVPDHVGFGRSDKPRDPAYYTLERHIRNLETLMAHAQARDVVPVLHDWGGPIGMGYATRHPADILGLVVLNTWAFVEKPVLKLPWSYRLLLGGDGGCRRITKRNFFTETILARGGTARALTANEVDAYRAPHPSPDDRAGVARFPQLVPQTADTDHESWSTMKTIEDALPAFENHPALIVWAMKDIAFRKAFLDRWKEVLPAHTGPILLPHARHYLQEDAPTEVLAAIEPFAAKLEERLHERRAFAEVAAAAPVATSAPPAPTPAEARAPVNVVAPPPPPPTEPIVATPVLAEVVDARQRAAKPAWAPSHLVEDRDPKKVQRVAKRDPGRIDDKKPRLTKGRVVGRKNGAVAVKRAQRPR